MARLVFAAATPHAPAHPQQVLDEGPASETGALYRKVAEQLESAEPDLIVFFASDHFTNFFYDKLPAICIGLTDEANGPEPRVEMPRYKVRLHEPFARGLFAYALNQEFDAASAEEFTLDHSILVPLHFLTPRMHIPIVPVWIRGLMPPLPLARRCLALGQMVREYITQWPGQERVAVLASGSFSLEVGGPRFEHRDEAWVETVVGCLREGRVEDLVQQATTERMLAAGNVCGELLDWIALLGAVGTQRPQFVDPQEGHAFAVWHL